ncbi:MAG: Acyltransferase [Mucilaginibacter sp.]|nr:Acyltransferase [Mucilaginibacter sp.]
MMIKAKPLPIKVLEKAAMFASWITRRRFNKMVINNAEIKPGHSYLLMCNHFSFWDGIWAIYLSLHGVHKKQPLKGFYIMSLKKQMEKHWWLKYIGAFSIAPGPRSVAESLRFAAEILSEPGNLLLFYPQGNLESEHVRYIEFKEGINTLVPQIKGDCQLIWCSILTEYFESLKPTVYFNMLDCGTNHEFNFEALKQKVNEHHLQAIQNNIRFTKEPGN